MNNSLYNWLNKRYPQNYIIKKPLIGSLIIALFCFGFAVTYKPLGAHASRFFNYGETMAVYALVIGLSIILSTKLLKVLKQFSKLEEWTIIKELVAIILVLFGAGIAIYFLAFFIELPGDRWNLSTFFDSCKNAFLVGILPFVFFSALNYRYLYTQSQTSGLKMDKDELKVNQTVEEKIQINSKLKKEELSFYPNQLIYAESDGNYVVFYLNHESGMKKVSIRNSMSSIEQQLSPIPYYFRTHRAFIVNVKEVNRKNGNTMGYRLQLNEIDFEIPVSRKNTKLFDKCLAQYK